MSDLGALFYYLSIEVRQGKEELTLGQSAYASKLLICSVCAPVMIKSSTYTPTTSSSFPHHRV